MQEKQCDNCDSKNRCSDTYQRIGSAQGPSVAIKVIVAFLIPIITFLGTAVLCDRFLPATPGPRSDFKPLAGFVISASITMAVLYLTKMINSRLMKNKQDLKRCQ